MIQKIRKAQSIVEYLLVFAAIVLAVLFGATKLGKAAKGQAATAGNVVNRTTEKVNAAF